MPQDDWEKGLTRRDSDLGHLEVFSGPPSPANPAFLFFVLVMADPSLKNQAIQFDDLDHTGIQCSSASAL